MKVLKQGDIYAPEHLGRKDILIEGSRIARIADHIDEYDQIEEVEKVDLGGHILTPGYMDIHVHITGGGGESGPATRVPEASLSVLVRNGITTVVGLLGTDGITRSLENLLAKARAFNEEGITCRILTGAYGYPSPTITGSVERDIALIDLMVGVKIAMSDHRSSNLTGEQLISLATQARGRACSRGAAAMSLSIWEAERLGWILCFMRLTTAMCRFRSSFPPIWDAPRSCLNRDWNL